MVKIYKTTLLKNLSSNDYKDLLGVLFCVLLVGVLVGRFVSDFYTSHINDGVEPVVDYFQLRNGEFVEITNLSNTWMKGSPDCFGFDFDKRSVENICEDGKVIILVEEV